MQVVLPTQKEGESLSRLGPYLLRHGLSVSVIVPLRPGAPEPRALEVLQASRQQVEVILVRGECPARERNIAAREASGDLFLFLDDDSVPSPDLLDAYLEAFRRAPEAAAIGGPAVHAPGGFRERLAAAVLSEPLVTGLSASRYSPQGASRKSDERELILANLAVRRSAFARAGGFDEALYPSEENHLLDRLRDFGEEVRYEPTAVVTRPAPRAGFELLWKVFGYGRGRAAQGRRRLTLASAVRVSTAQVALLAIFTAAAALPWTVLPLIALGACLLPYYLALVVQVAVRDGLGVAVLAPFAATGVHLAYAAGILSGLIRRLPARRGEVTVEKRTLGGSSAHRASFRSVDEALADQEPGVENAALSVIVPTYNEAANLPELLGRLKSALAGSDFEVIVVDDQSPDGTRGVAESVAAELAVPLRVLTREGPRSLSLAVIEGARAARHASVVVLDADLSHDPAQVRELSEAVLGGRCDLAVASRYVAVGDIDLWPLGRRLLSRTGTLLARLLTPVWVSDPLSGYFACRRDLLAGEVELRPRGYKILLEVLARAPELRVREFPTRFRDRERGQSKLRLRQKLEFLAQILSLVPVRLRRLFPSRSIAKARRVFT